MQVKTTKPTGTITREVRGDTPDDSFSLVLSVPTFGERLHDMALYTLTLSDPGKLAVQFESRLDAVKGWSGIVDDDGKAVEFSQDTLRAAITNDAAFGFRVLSTLKAHWLERLTETERKNSEPQSVAQ